MIKIDMTTTWVIKPFEIWGITKVSGTDINNNKVINPRGAINKYGNQGNLRIHNSMALKNTMAITTTDANKAVLGLNNSSIFRVYPNNKKKLTRITKVSSAMISSSFLTSVRSR